MRAWPSIPVAATILVLIAGCSSTDVTLDSRPTDADSAQALAELVAETAQCGSFEYFNDTPHEWAFTCQSGEASYDIRVVPDEGAKRAVLQALGSAPPVKEGAYYLVQAATNEDGSASGDLDRFPGDVAAAGSG
jgi:hypothetical protein